MLKKSSTLLVRYKFSCYFEMILSHQLTHAAVGYDILYITVKVIYK